MTNAARGRREKEEEVSSAAAGQDSHHHWRAGREIKAMDAGYDMTAVGID
ncbi:hypothetical protein [Luteipulveratus mongoliensis]|nr:hypothetical protein [Luteipulveratus mongoliensis]